MKIDNLNSKSVNNEVKMISYQNIYNYKRTFKTLLDILDIILDITIFPLSHCV